MVDEKLFCPRVSSTSKIYWDECARRAHARVQKYMDDAIFATSESVTVVSDALNDKEATENAFDENVHQGDACRELPFDESGDPESLNAHDMDTSHHALDASSNATLVKRIQTLELELESEKQRYRQLVDDFESRECDRVSEIQALSARARNAEAARAEANAEISHLNNELSRIETVIRQEESVVRLRLEAEHEVRVGRLATELDRVRGDLEAKTAEIHEMRDGDAKTFGALNAIRDELLGKVKSEVQRLTGTIDEVYDAIGSSSRSLRRENETVPRMSQCVPSLRERSPISTTKSPRNGHALAEPSTPGRSSSHRSSVSSQRRGDKFQLSAFSDRKSKPVSSNKGLVGYANIH